jgi:hypothetical protein
MMNRTILVFALLIAGGATVAVAGEKKSYRCTGTAEQCKYMPAPPAPPTPPTPPSLPALPTPPEPPAPPEVPTEAHALCKGKDAGTRITYTPNKNEIIEGTCRRTAEGMRLELRSWTVEM